MPLLPRKGALAIAAVIDIALNARSRPVAAKSLATRHRLPPRHLEPVLQALVRHGILKGTRGPRGGYELAREQRRITADDILRAAGTADDINVLDAVLAAAASERLGGDPLWLLVISGPGNAKTETVQALMGAGAIAMSARSLPSRTSASSTGSRCRGGRRWRVASDLAATGRPRALIAMSMTAAMAKAPLRGRSCISFPQFEKRVPKSVGPSFPSRARRTKTPNSACCFIKTCDFADGGLQGCYQHQLCDARPALDRERVLAKIRKDYMNFAAVIGIKRARGIEHRDAVVQRQAGTRPDLSFNSCG